VRPLRVAGAGAGYFSRFHREAWRAEPAVTLVGWCDSDAARAAEVADEGGLSAAWTDTAAMLDAVQPDLLDIVTPPASHLALVALAAARGIPCICQKPLAPHWVDCLALAATVESAGTLCVVHENFRFQPWYREAKRLLDAGALGTPHGATFRLRPGDGQGPAAYLDRQPYFQTMPRLLVVETAVHWIDTFRFLFGDVEAVTARLRRINPAIAGEDAGCLILEFAQGTMALFDGNRCNDHVAADPRRTMGECWIEGSAGVLRLDGDARLWFKPHHGKEREHAYERGPATFGGGCVAALQRHVIAHLRDGTPIENRVADYLDNVRVQEAAYASHAAQRRIALRGFEPPSTAAPFHAEPAAMHRT
jgi:predicted dehydrogenase